MSLQVNTVIYVIYETLCSSNNHFCIFQKNKCIFNLHSEDYAVFFFIHLITLYKLCSNSILCSFFITVYLTVHCVVLQTLVYNLIHFQLFPN